MDFWFRVADRRNRRAWESSREIAREGYIANTGCQPVSAVNLNSHCESWTHSETFEFRVKNLLILTVAISDVTCQDIETYLSKLK